MAKRFVSRRWLPAGRGGAGSGRGAHRGIRRDEEFGLKKTTQSGG